MYGLLPWDMERLEFEELQQIDADLRGRRDAAMDAARPSRRGG